MSITLAPLIANHAARLEQLSDVQSLTDANAVVRSLRTVTKLYDLDVAVAHRSDVLNRAIVAALHSAATPIDVASRAQDPELGGVLPDVDGVIASQPFTMMLEVLDRLRTLLTGRTAVALSLPTQQELSVQLGGIDDDFWLEDLFAAALSAIGEHEPDYLLTWGAGDLSPVDLGIAEHFGIEVIRPNANPETITVVPGDMIQDFMVDPSTTWLLTSSEVPPQADPKELAAGFKRLRGR